MIDKKEASKIVNRRPKREFSLEDKQRFYNQWKESGLNKNQFCKMQDLVLSSFSQWCRKLSGNKGALSFKNNWIPIVSKNKILSETKDPMIIEIKVPKTTKICVCLLLLVLLLGEFLNAINTIW